MWFNLLYQISGVVEGSHSSTASLTNGHLASTEWSPPGHMAACSLFQQHTQDKVLFDISILSNFWKADHLGILIPNMGWDNPGAVPCWKLIYFLIYTLESVSFGET